MAGVRALLLGCVLVISGCGGAGLSDAETLWCTNNPGGVVSSALGLGILPTDGSWAGQDGSSIAAIAASNPTSTILKGLMGEWKSIHPDTYDRACKAGYQTR